jgi:hypothetical protein
MTIARDLSIHLAELLRRERHAMADFLAALADFDQRRPWIELGHGSLFAFLHVELGLSKSAAYYRKSAAELIQRFPEIIEPLRDGRLCLSSVTAVAKVITPENRAEVLPRFFHRSKREAAEVVAEIRPVEAPPRRAVVTSLRPSAKAEVTLNLEPSNARAGSVTDVPGLERTATVQVHPENLTHANSPADARGSSSHAEPLRIEPQPTEVEPLTADLRRYHLTVSKRFLAKLGAARDALSHAKPGATPEEILEAGLDLLLAQDAKRKGLVARPRQTPPPSTTDRVPAHVRRDVFLRDGGRCQVPLASGDGVCGSTYQVQLGHLTPRARGGPPTVDNLRCECAVHNQAQADRDFGAEYMAQFRRRRARTGS